ncbi:sugar-binding domain-containing protein [Xylanibacter brevis]|uniref:sugar-binding domain-containing protein n=1 Tax=Xylanibacter brevis TaxID=83231 RepID=UPI0004841FF0|nr:sugar-binding domain-containing protein [Xylanibacter brevis]
MKRISFLLMAVIATLTIHAQQVISLAGAWDFAMGDTPQYNDYVMLPGSMLTNEKGHRVSVHTQWTGSLYDSSYYFNPYMAKYRQEGDMKFPFFLTPNRHYVGNAWYRKQVYVPRSWSNQRITLFLERPHIETTVYVNGKEVGHQMSLSVPHRYDVTKYITFGGKNDIAVKVYNGIENVCVGQDSHSVTDQTQGNWNGIAGRIELQAQWKKLNIKHVRIVPNVAERSAQIEVELENHTDGVRVLPKWEYDVHVEVSSMTGRHYQTTMSKEALGNKKVFKVKLGSNAQLWDEFHPHLYQLTIEAGEDIYQTTFGLREITTRQRQLFINGRPLFLRGTVENCCFPETGYPPTDEAEWLRIFKKCKEYGLNHVRFHSYCPPEAAFAAADKLGIYLQPEGPTWPNHGVKLRRGMAIDKYLMDESKRIIDEYGHHPSFVMMAAGNEPAGDWVSYCNDWVKEMRKYDPTKLYAGASVGGGWAWDSESDYHVKGGARGLNWDKKAPQSADDYFDGILFPRNYKGDTPNESPIVTHEKGQWCAFPDFGEVTQYTGAYHPGNFEIFRDLLRDNGMEQMDRKFLMASGKLQTLCYKYEIERNLRTKDYAGFQLLGLNDYSGQGTALVGVLNVFWREKGYCTARDWTQFCNAIVPLARFPQFVYTTADTLRVPVEAYNATFATLTDVNATYSIYQSDSASVVASGRLSELTSLPVGKNHALGTVTMPLANVQAPAKFTLEVQLSPSYKNHWDFWVYPAQTTADAGSVYIADSLDAKAQKVLRKGGTVLLTAAGKVTLGSDVKQSYLPVFWNTSWFKMRPPHTTGAYIDTTHPLFKYGFPTDDWSNLNWWELLNKAQVMNLMELPRNYQSPIQPIDTWHVSRKLGMLVEAKVGKGRLLMTTMDISNRLENRPVARQMRQAILSYMQSDDFRPSLELDTQTILDFYSKQAPAVNMFTNDSPDELKPKLK